MQDFTGPPAKDPSLDNQTGKDIVERLRAGKLPQMVDWFDPRLLAKVGVRAVISATLGAYTDQRLMQAATDNASEQELKARYDYSGAGAAPALPADHDGAVWVDYIADLGDGFEATYAMAYLLAPDRLKVEGEASALPAGQLLVMGGDQVYPDATKQEYHNRLRDPYDWAFTTDNPTRKVFAIPGNHDWYDGLAAFGALFCSARDRISGGVGSQLGGWRCQQHRSYFAIKLPHNWWIWGPDIQLADNLDDSQRDYFDLMADQTTPDDNIILCLAEPSWHHKNYDNMHEISMLARKKGAKICLVVAGDWHHYSRYANDALGTQFITSGGGGAFAHSTHGLKDTIELKWAAPTGSAPTSSPEDTRTFNRSERSVIGPGGPDFTQRRIDISVGKPFAAGDGDKPGSTGRRAKAVRKEEIESTAYGMTAPHIYPPRWKSRALSLRNLWLPFRNKMFAVLVGIVYFIFAWVWAASDPRQSPILLKVSEDVAAQTMVAERLVAQITKDRDKLIADRSQLSPEVLAGPVGITLERDLARATDRQAEVAKVLDFMRSRNVAIDGGRQTLLEQSMAKFKASVTDKHSTLQKLVLMLGVFHAYNSLEYVFDAKAFFIAGEQNPLFAFLLIGLWAGLVFYAESPWRRLAWTGKVLFGSIHFAAHIAALLFISWIATGISNPAQMLLTDKYPTLHGLDIARVIWNFAVTLLLGGILGGLVMGLYWTLTCAIFNCHTGDAFGALGLKDYKNFLRLKLEPGRLTVYPIALDKVPGRKGWRWELGPGEARPAHNPQIMPIEPLQPRLIEPPIVILAEKVRP